MNAKEAREKATAVNIDSESSQYANVKKVITSAVKKGEYKCYYYDALKPEVSLKLKNDGYTITAFFDQREGTTVTISW